MIEKEKIKLKKLKSYSIQDCYGSVFRYFVYTKADARECFNAAEGKDNFCAFIKPLICPNCKRDLEFNCSVKYGKENYDKWVCEDCIHIIVLDYRSE